MQQPWGKVTVAVQEKRGNINALHTKAFTAWINSSLRGVVSISDCTKELGTGIVLIQLIERFTGIKCPFPYKVPSATNRTLCIDTVSVALRFLAQYVPNLAISPADVVDGNTQVILGLLWRLILKWQNVLQQHSKGEVGEQVSSESVVKTTKDAKAKLIEWIRSKVGSYQHVRITNDFVESFDSGMALCALVHAYDPSLIPYEMLDPSRKLDNLALGMQLAEQYLGVAGMLDPADVAEADDKAMMVYLYEFPKAFLSRLQVAGGEGGEEDRRQHEEQARRAAVEEEARRRRISEEEALRRQAEDDARQRQEEARRRAEEDARRRAEEEARRWAEEEALRRRLEEDEMRRRAAVESAEQERMRMFQQFQQQPTQQHPPVVVAVPPQFQTIVIKELSNIGRLTVDVVSCRGLKPQDVLTNTANPYVVIQVERQKERTRKEKHSLNPNFNERFKFYVSESYASVDVCVFDSTMLIQDYFLGKVEVLVRSLSVDVPVEKWYALQPLHHGGKAVGGEILLKLLLTRE